MATKKKTTKAVSKSHAKAKSAPAVSRSMQDARLTAMVAVFAALCVLFAAMVYMNYGR